MFSQVVSKTGSFRSRSSRRKGSSDKSDAEYEWLLDLKYVRTARNQTLKPLQIVRVACLSVS